MLFPTPSISYLLLAISTTCVQSVTVQGGGVEYVGVYNETFGINTFWGIKYAKAPMGDLRWRAPVPVQYDPSSQRTVNATSPGPACVQCMPSFRPTNLTQPQDEDCLLLNIQTSAKPRSNGLPVLVHIHGGGYAQGSVTSSTGDSLLYQANGEMVYVSIQYRLGPLGFLASSDLKSDGTANAGLLDQRAALEWLRSNIHYFGGDPSRITIMGQSAGGGSITMQMIMYGGAEEPPFHAAIAEYPWWTPMFGEKWQNTQYTTFLDAANCSTLECMRSLSTAEIQTATTISYDVAYNEKQFGYGTFYWGPVIDGEVIRDHPLEELRNGHFTKVPIIVDHNFDEGFIFSNYSITDEDEIRSDLETLWQDSDGYYTEVALRLYPESVYNESHFKELRQYQRIEQEVLNGSLSASFARRSAIFGDAIVSCPSSYVATSVAKAGLPVYKLIFDSGSQFHGTTIGFFLGNHTKVDGTYTSLGLVMPGNATVAEYMQYYVISFTLHHDPNKFSVGKDSTPYWPRYELDHPEILYIGGSDVYTEGDPEISASCKFFQMGRGNNAGYWPQW